MQASSSDPSTQASNLINISGLRDRDSDGLEEHSGDPTHMWLSASGEAKNWVEFDFGEVQKLSTLCIWNYNDKWHTDRGVQQADLSVWTPAAGWRKVREGVALTAAEGSDDYDEPAVVALDTVEAQKVRLDNLVSLGDADCVGLSEVQFFQPRGPQAARPYPPDGADACGTGDLALAWLAGEGAKAHHIYVGTTPDDLKLLGKVEQAGAKLSDLKNGSKYYWRVDEVQADGSTAQGPVWNLTTGLLAAWWKLDEAEGTKVADSSGNGHEGTAHGSPTWQPAGGRVGGALQCDGVDDYVDTGWAADLPAWTVAAWIRSPSAPVAPTASGPIHRENNLQINWNHGDDVWRGATGLRVGGTWYASSFGELKADTWYHMVATFDGKSLNAYKDGTLVTHNTAAAGKPDAESATLTLGKHATADAYFTGTIDDVSIFTYALSAEEVKTLYSGKEPTALAAQPSSTGPRLVQAASAASVAPAPAASVTPASASPQPLVQPAGAEVSGPATAAPQPSHTSRNLAAVVVILAAVGLIVGVSTLGKKKLSS